MPFKTPYIALTTSENSTPDATATKLRLMKLIDLLGLIKISPLNSFLSMTDGGLLVPSQTTLKSMIPLLDLTSLKNGSMIETNWALVKSSLNSNKENRAALAIAFSRMINNLRTLILSKADGFAYSVLSPNKTVPCPGKDTTGLIPFTYKSSLFVLVGSNANLVTFLILPLLNPA